VTSRTSVVASATGLSTTRTCTPLDYAKASTKPALAGKGPKRAEPVGAPRRRRARLNRFRSAGQGSRSKAMLATSTSFGSGSFSVKPQVTELRPTTTSQP